MRGQHTRGDPGCHVLRVGLFFFKQKTAYEMSIGDWSSDVCSSDLQQGLAHRERLIQGYALAGAGGTEVGREVGRAYPLVVGGQPAVFPFAAELGRVRLEAGVRAGVVGTDG